MEIVLRATVMFAIVYLLVRVLGKRELGQMTPFEFIVMVVIGDLIQQGITQNDFSITGATLAICTFAFWGLVLSWFSYLSPRAARLLEGEPRVIVRHGEVLQHSLKRDRLTLGEIHVRWQPGPFDLSALYSRGEITDTEKLNLTFIGNPYPVPKSFWGGYVQAAMRAWEHGDSSLSPFVRYEQFNTAASFEPVPLGLGVTTAPTEKVWTAGINYYLTPQVVFKADYQHFNIADALLGYGTRFDLGVGYQF